MFRFIGGADAEDGDGSELLADVRGYDISPSQERVRRIAESRRQVRRMADDIARSLGAYAARLEREGLYVRVRRR